MTANNLNDVIDVTSAEDELALLQSKAWHLESSGALGEGLSGMINQTIDGVYNFAHILQLREYFENYGIKKNGTLVRLAEMGRTEPIEPTAISDYAFAIQEDHLDVDW